MGGWNGTKTKKLKSLPRGQSRGRPLSRPSPSNKKRSRPKAPLTRDHPCEVQAVTGTAHRFLISPSGETWSFTSGGSTPSSPLTGSFTKFTAGEDGQRIFYFDAKKSEWGRDKWVQAIDDHIKYARRERHTLGELDKLAHEYTATTKDEKLGLQPSNWPPGLVRIRHIEKGYWAEEQGIEVGSLIIDVNGRSCETLAVNDFSELLVKRPVSMSIVTWSNLPEKLKDWEDIQDDASAAKYRLSRLPMPGLDKKKGGIASLVAQMKAHQIAEHEEESDDDVEDEAGHHVVNRADVDAPPEGYAKESPAQAGVGCATWPMGALATMEDEDDVKKQNVTSFMHNSPEAGEARTAWPKLTTLSNGSAPSSPASPASKAYAADADRSAVVDVLNRYIQATKDYDSEEMMNLFLSRGEQTGVVNGYFGRKMMLESDGKGTDFMLAFLNEEKDTHTCNLACQGHIRSVEVFGSVASAIVSIEYWCTSNKGIWSLDESLHLMKLQDDAWKIVARLYSARKQHEDGQSSGKRMPEP